MKYSPVRLFLTAALAAFAFSAQAADAPLSRSDVEGIVKDYITSHPEVVMDSLRAFQQKQQAQDSAKAGELLKTRSKEIFNDPTSPVAGNPKGDVAVVEFFDYHCGYCKRALPTVTQLIKDDKKVKVIFKDYPILSADSELAAKAAIAVSLIKPDKYFEYHTALMNVSGKYDEATVLAEAKKLGLDEAKVKKEMEGKTVADELQKNKELASALGIRGTPAFIIGETIIPGAVSIEDLKKSVEEARKKK